MKKIFAIFVVLAFTAGMTFAQTNVAQIVQEGNTNEALATQVGTLNDANILQENINDEAIILQNGTSNDADIEQGFHNWASGNRSLADIKQDGIENEALVMQTGRNDVSAWVDQSGYKNKAEVDQNKSTGRNWAEAHIDQVGDENYAYQKQRDRRGLKAEIDQEGTLNHAEQSQKLGGSGHGDLGIVTTIQYGTENKAYTYQNTERGFVKIEQDGVVEDDGNNLARVNQGTPDDRADDSYVNVLQEGINNIFKVEQTGSFNAIGGSPFTQTGDGNKFAGVVKDGDDLTFQVDEFAIQDGGATLDVASYQTGDGNMIGLHQGAGDWALIQQDNDLNTTLLWQSGGGQQATIFQNGNENHAEVQQSNLPPSSPL